MSQKINILYASQTGTAEDLAFDIHKKATSSGLNCELNELDDISMDKFKDMNKLMLITSTTGDGEIPDNGQIFWEDLSSKVDLNLSNLKYGVLALGDSSHYDFCNAGKIFDKKLEELGGNRIIKMLECDYDTEGSEDWSKKFFEIINKF